jgi:formylglycine-generating enzyme
MPERGSRMSDKAHPNKGGPLTRFALGLWLCMLLILMASAAPSQAAPEGEESEGGAPQAVEAEDDGKQRIAILQFEAVNEEAQAGNKGRMVAEMLTTEAFKTGLFHVVERHLIKKVMDEMEFGESAFSGTDAQKIGVMLGADAVLTGAVSEFLGVLRIDARLINVQDGRILLADGAQAQLTMQDISQAVQLLMGKMISAVGVEQEVAVAEAAPPETQLPPASKPSQGQAPPPVAITGAANPVPGQPWNDPLSGLGFVWLSGGCYMQGSPSSEPGRDSDEKQHEVCLEGFWMSAREVSVEDFRRFVEATGYVTDAEREGHAWIYQGKKTRVDGQNWRRTRFPQTARDPVINVSWYDAKAYCDWLARETGLNYRLPTEGEWEYGCRAGSRGRYFWGEDQTQACAFANVHDRTSRNVNGYTWQSFPCDDGFAQTAPTGNFQPNAFGLHDMLGNVWEWTGSADGSGKRYARGGSWDDRDKYVRCANRDRLDPGFRTYSVGFRPVLEQ